MTNWLAHFCGRTRWQMLKDNTITFFRCTNERSTVDILFLSDTNNMLVKFVLLMRSHHDSMVKKAFNSAKIHTTVSVLISWEKYAMHEANFKDKMHSTTNPRYVCILNSKTKYTVFKPVTSDHWSLITTTNWQSVATQTVDP